MTAPAVIKDTLGRPSVELTGSTADSSTPVAYVRIIGDAMTGPLSIANDAIGHTPLSVKAFAGQTADLVKIFASDGTTKLAGIDASGGAQFSSYSQVVTTKTSSAPTTSADLEGLLVSTTWNPAATTTNNNPIVSVYGSASIDGSHQAWGSQQSFIVGMAGVALIPNTRTADVYAAVGVWGIVQKQNTSGNMHQLTGALIRVDNWGATVDQHTGVDVTMTIGTSTNTAVSTQMAAVWIHPPTVTHAGSGATTAYGVFIESQAVAGITNPWSLYVNGGRSNFNGDVIISSGNFYLPNHNRIGIGDLTIEGGPFAGIHIHGEGILVSGLDTPAIPTVTPQGTTGSTTYLYAISAISGATGSQTTGGPFRTITNGNATLNATNFNRITWAAIEGAVGYAVYKGDYLHQIILGNVLTYDDKGGATTTTGTTLLLVPGGQNYTATARFEFLQLIGNGVNHTPLMVIGAAGQQTSVAIFRAGTTYLASIAQEGTISTIGNLQMLVSHAPATSSDAGTAGTIAWDTGFFYVCTASNTWKRAALSTF